MSRRIRIAAPFRRHLNDAILALFVGSFLLGSFLGASVGSAFFSGLELAPAEDAPFLLHLLRCGFMVAMAQILGTSYLGCFLLPILCVMRGYLISCCAAQVMADSARPILSALIRVGIPSALTLPCFLLSCLAAMSASLHLFRLRCGRLNSPPLPAYPYLLPLCCTFLPLAAVLECYLVPRLWTLI